MRVVVREEPMDRTALAWWAALGMGLGLVLLSVLLWWRQGSPDDANQAFSEQLARLEPVLLHLHKGELPSDELLDRTQAAEFQPLIQALVDAARQRDQALGAYQAQVEVIALGDWLTPPHLISTKGRSAIRQRLVQLDQALEDLIRQDASVQAHLDESLSVWLRAQPEAIRADDARRRLLQASTPASHVMTSFFKVERDIIAQVAGMLDLLEAQGTAVSLEMQPQPDLVFQDEAHLNQYRQGLMKLGQLGDREAQLMDAARHAPEQQAKLVGAWLVATSDVAH